MSDRLGRVVTLRVAAACWVVAQTCLLVDDDSFALILAGQFFLAGGFASLSGTDVTFHYDSLEAVGRAGEYPARQARVSAIGFGATAISAVAGGLIGYVELRAVFAVALALAVLQFGMTLFLTEPGELGEDADATPGLAGRRRSGPDTGHELAPPGFGAQLRDCAAYLRAPFLGWLFAYGVVLVTLEHVAFSILQPWLTELTDGTATDVGSTPLLSGVVFAVVALVGSAAARSSEPLARRFGTVATLLGLGALSAVIVTSMALWVAPLVLGLVALRSVQGAAAPVLISDAVSARVARHHRATLLSLNSLAGRLAWGLAAAGGRALDRRRGRVRAVAPGGDLLGPGGPDGGRGGVARPVGGPPRSGPGAAGCPTRHLTSGPPTVAQLMLTMPMRTACSTACVRSRASSFW